LLFSGPLLVLYRFALRFPGGLHISFEAMKRRLPGFS
jgi:hypothetical protein